MRRNTGAALVLLLLAAASAVSALSLLSAPSGLTCQSGPDSGAVVLYFTGTNDASLLYYEVDYSTPLGASVSVVSSQSPVVLTGLTPGFSYGFSVSTVNAVGSSLAATTTCVGGDVPSVPLNPTAMWNATAAALVIGWTPPVTTGGTKTLTYRVSLYNTTGALLSTKEQARSPATIYSVPGSGSYTWSVLAFNTIGQGPATNASAFAIGAATTVPTVPQNLIFTPTAVGMQVAFSPPAFDGGSPILSYSLQVNGGAAITTTTSPMMTASLPVGVHTFSLVAINAIGSSPVASNVLSYSPGADTPPSPPTNVGVSVVGSLMTITWTASVSSSVKYIVYVSSMTGNSVVPLASVNSDQTTGTTLTIDGFCTDSYLVYVKAVSTVSGLMSVASSPMASATTTATAPGVPTNIQIVNLGASSVAVYFGSPATGSIAAQYELTWHLDKWYTVAGSYAPLIATGLPASPSTSLSLVARSECDALQGTPSSISVVPKEPVVYRAPIIVTLNASSIVLSSGTATVSFNVTTPEAPTTVSFYDVGSGSNTNVYLSSQVFDPVNPSANTVTFSGLTDGTYYSVYAIARTHGGKTADSNIITFRPYGPITAPQNFTCVPGADDQTITCRWNPPASLGGLALVGYTVVPNPGPSAGYATSGSPIELHGLTVDSPYSISIYARTSITTSPTVMVTNVYPGDPPAPPTASCTDDAPNQVTLTITPSLDTGGMNPAATSGGMSLISYQIHYLIGTQVQVDINNSLSTTRTFPAIPGDIFHITVMSWNSAGMSMSSAEATCSAANPPSCPLNLALYPGLVNAGALFANWTQESSNGGAAVTEYLVTWTGDVSGQQNITAPLREIQLTGLTSNNGNYSVLVQARNRKGLSTGCTAVVGQASGTPGAPVLSALGSANTMLLASLVAANQTGGVPLILWNCSVTPSSATGVAFQTFSSWSTMPLTLTGLTNGVSYSVSCRVTNSIGLVSAASNILAAIPATVPNHPTLFNATTGPGLGQLNVSWVPSANNGGNAVDGFNITYVGLTAAGGSGFRYVSPVVTPYALQLSGLVPGEFYTLTIQAHNSLGFSTGAVSGENSLVAQAGGPPCPPLNVLVTPGDKYLEVTWNAPTCDGGLAIKMYWIWTASASGPNAITSVLFGSNVARTVNLTGLVNGVAYTVYATAANVAANSTAAVGSPNTVSPLSAPSAPILTGTSVLDGALLLLLSPPVDLGGRTLAGYTCFMNSSAFAPTSWLATPIPFGPTGPFQVSGLTNGLNYSVACYASNSAGLTGPFSRVVFGAPAQVPGPPTNAVAVSGPALGQINVSWVGPLSSGGSPLTSFIVSWKDSAGGRNGSVVVSPSSNWQVLSLVSNITYTISIQAVNAQGASAITPGIGTHVVSAIAAAVPCPPLNPAAIRGNASLIVSWDTPLCNGGMAITGYWIFVTDVATGAGRASFVPVGSLSYTQLGLTNGLAYSVSLTAANVLGNSTLVFTADNVIPATISSAPTNFGCQSGPTLLGSISLHWSLPLSFGGDPSPTSYNFTVVELSSGATFVRNCVSFSCALESLNPRSNYSMVAVAINTVGAGLPTAPIYCTAASVPDQIAPVSCSGANLQINLVYAAPYSNLDLTSYEANYTAAAATTPQTATRPLLPITSLTSGLINDVIYTVTVRGCNLLGCGVASAAIQCQPGVPPTVPTSVQCKPENTKIHLVYSLPAGGSAATSYSAFDLADQTLITTTGLEIIFTGYTPNTPHSYVLWARNAHGTSSNVSVSCSTLQLAPPDNVLSFLDLAKPASTCAVWFTPYPQIPASGSFATLFIVQYVKSPSTVYSELNATTIPVFIPNLVANQIYNLKIYASNGFAMSAATTGTCNTGAVYDPARIPSAPGARSSPGAGQSVVALSLPSFQGTAPDTVGSYRLFTSGSAGSSIIASVDSDLSFVTVPGLTNGLQYYHYALADNNQGLPSPVPLSLPSPIVSEVPLARYTVPTPPTQASIKMTPGDTSVAFDVLSAAGNPSGSPLLGYVVRWPVTTAGSPVVAGSSASNSSVATVPHILAHSNLINGVGTQFTVEAINGAGASVPLYTPAVTPGRLPGPPVNVVASPHDHGADVFFQPPVDPGTNTVAGYFVYYRDAALVALSPKSGPPIPIVVDSLTNGISNNLTICAYSSVSGTYAGAPPLWQSAPGSCVSFSVIPFARPLPNLNGTLIFSAPMAASLRTTGVQALDNFCLTRMAYTRALVCDPTTGRTFLSALTYLPAAAPVFAFNAFLKPVAAYSKIASSPTALLASGIQTSESLGFAANFTTFFDETAPVGAVVSPGVSNLATTVAFTGCNSAGTVSTGFGTCNGWTSTLAGDSASTGKDFALSSAADFTSGWLDDGVGDTCDTNLAVYCAWFPSASDGVRNGDETGVDCGGTTLFFDGQPSFPCNVPPPVISCPAVLYVPTSVSFNGVLILPNLTVSSLIRYDVSFAYMVPGVFPHAEARTGDSISLLSNPTMLLATAIDGKGQQGNCTFPVVVRDVVPPTIVCPLGPIFITADPGFSYATGVTYPPSTAFDNVPLPVNISGNPPASQRFPVGSNIVYVYATDAAGNVANCSFELRVGDAQPPVLTFCPAAVINQSTDIGQRYATLLIPQPTAVDNVGLVNPRGVQLSGPANGTRIFVARDTGFNSTLIRFMFEDTSGNQVICAFTMEIIDMEPPALVCAADVTTFTDPSCSSAVLTIKDALAVSDNVNLTRSVTQPQFAVGVSKVQVTARDERGNIGTCTYSVTVIDNEPPRISCPPDMQKTLLPGEAIAAVNWTVPVSSDNVGVVSVTSNYASGDYFPASSVNVVTYTARDAAGLSASCSFMLRVLSSSNPPSGSTAGLGDPGLQCPSDLVRVASYNSDPPTALVNWLPPSLTNTRLVATLSGSALGTNNTYFPVGTRTLTYALTDAMGNGVTCSFRISVLYPTAQPEGAPSRGQLSLRNVTTDVLSIQRHLIADLAAVLQISTVRISVIAVVAAFNRTDVVFEFAPRAPTYYAALAAAGSGRRLLAALDSAESEDVLWALQTQLNDPTSALYASAMANYIVGPATFVNCSDAFSAPLIERATGCQYKSTAALGSQCPAGCVPLTECASGGALSDRIVDKQWFAIVITCACWLGLLLLLFLLQACGVIAFTGAIVGYGQARVKKQPPVVPWPHIRNNHFRPLAEDNRGYMH